MPKLIDPKGQNATGGCVHPDALAEIQKRGGQWAAYQNYDIGSRQVGHIKFLRYGEGCTHQTPPPHYPHPSVSQGTNYLLVGVLDTKTGVIA